MIIKEIKKQSYMNNNYYTDQKMQKSQQYIEALKEERRKIQVFHRELPLCLELVTQAISACRQQQLSGTTTTESYFGQSECSEQTSSEGPVLEEFIPMKRTSCSDEEEEEQSHKPNNTDSICSSQNRDDKNINSDNSLKKSDWLRSVQLWNQTSDPPMKEDSPRKVLVTEVHKNGGGHDGGGPDSAAFHPFKRERTCGIAPELMGSSPSSAMSSAERGGSASGGGGGGDDDSETKREESGGHSQRKAKRRCWSPELHRRFINALQQLGGSQVATPKQIRELMKVDGLTNDEVKSHLQKYRLHERRPIPSIHNNNSQAPRFVVVGGIWVPPPAYAAAAAAAASTTTASAEVSGAAATSNRIYAPKAATPPLPVSQAPASLPQTQQYKQFKQWHSDELGSHSDSRVKQSKQLHSHERGNHSKDRSAHSNSTDD